MSVRGADSIPAVREEEASGDIAILFEDLRVTLRVPFVNLIWRHLATIPGALPWVWTLVKPLYVSGELDRCAGDAAALASFPTLAPLPDFVWDSAGITTDDRQVIARLIERYNRANGVNFLALLAALSVLRDGLPARRVTDAITHTGKDQNHAPAEAVPPLPGLSELSPHLLALVRRLDEFGRLGASDAIASLYRHLAHWPAFLAVAYTALEPLHRTSQLARTQHRVIAFGHQQCTTLAGLVGRDLPEIAPEAKAAVLRALDEFTRLMIGRMIVMGSAMRALLASGTDQS
jgi:hypothetical protein